MRCSQQTLSWQIRCRFTLISSEFRNIFMGASTSYLVLLLQAGGIGRHAGEATLLGAAAPEASQTGAEPGGTFEGDVARESGAPRLMPPLPRAPRLWTRAPMAPRCSCDAIVEITGYTGSLNNLAVI